MSNSPNTWEDEGEHAESWRPAVGDVLEGILVSLEAIPDKYRPEQKAMVLKIRDAQGKLWIWFPGTDARKKIADRFRAALVDIGKPIAAKRGEDHETRNGILKTFAIKHAPTAEMARERALEAIEAEGPELDLVRDMKAARTAKPRGAQEVKSREQLAPDGFVDDVIDDGSIPF